MEFSIIELSQHCGCSERTFNRRIAKLKETGQFVKTSLGKFYNERDVLNISNLMGFSIKNISKKSLA